MKKVVLALIIAGSALLVTGGVIVAVGYASGQSVKVETVEYKDLEAFENFDFSLRVAELEIKPSTDSTRKVVIDETRYDKHTLEVKDNTLTIKGYDNRKWYEHIFTWAFYQKVKVTVYVPEGNYNNFKVVNSTGSIVVPSNYTFNSFDVKTSTGSITSSANVVNEVKAESSTGSVHFKDMTAKSASFKASTGSVHLKNLEVTEGIIANTSTGGIEAENVKCQNFTSNDSTGSVKLTNVIVDNHIEVKTSTGSIKLVDSDADTLYLKTSSGSVNATLLTDKIFYATSSSGSIRVPKSNTGGICEIHTSSGSITASIKSLA